MSTLDSIASIGGSGITGMPFQATLLHPTESDLMQEKLNVIHAFTALQFQALAISFDAGI
jgi:hypothetical protein